MGSNYVTSGDWGRTWECRAGWRSLCYRTGHGHADYRHLPVLTMTVHPRWGLGASKSSIQVSEDA